MRCNKKVIILIYLLSLSIYIAMSYITIDEMIEQRNVFEKLNIPSQIDSYNHIYVSLYFIILSTYLTIKLLELFSIPKIIDISVYIIGFSFASLALYKFHTVNRCVTMLSISHGLLLMLNLIDKIKHLMDKNNKN